MVGLPPLHFTLAWAYSLLGWLLLLTEWHYSLLSLLSKNLLVAVHLHLLLNLAMAITTTHWSTNSCSDSCHCLLTSCWHSATLTLCNLCLLLLVCHTGHVLDCQNSAPLRVKSLGIVHTKDTQHLLADATYHSGTHRNTSARCSHDLNTQEHFYKVQAPCTWTGPPPDSFQLLLHARNSLPICNWRYLAYPHCHRLQ